MLDRNTQCDTVSAELHFRGLVERISFHIIYFGTLQILFFFIDQQFSIMEFSWNLLRCMLCIKFDEATSLFLVILPVIGHSH